jgi:hypothetical protein
VPYAADTEVPVDRSKQQIEAMLKQRGCEGFASAWSSQGDTIEFMWKGMRIRFVVPPLDQEKYKHDAQGRERRAEVLAKQLAQANRARWRGLYLVVKAKLEAVESGISIFEEEFLAFIVDPTSNSTVGQVLVPRLLNGGKLLLTAGKET